MALYWQYVFVNHLELNCIKSLHNKLVPITNIEIIVLAIISIYQALIVESPVLTV